MPAKTIAIQGVPASFHDIAARQFFSQDIELVCCDTFPQVFEALKNGTADMALVAIENSLYGSINEVYDLLLKHKYWISGEVYLQVTQCLLGLPGSKVADITEVYSHPVALAQCEAYLDTTLAHAQRFETHDTAASAADIAQQQDPHKAAIASHAAAKAYGLEILAEHIETNPHNYTRFVALQKQETETAGNKTSLVLSTDHKPAALYNALGAFAKHKLNLSKLQSRPIIGKAWHYVFYVDIEAGAQDPLLQTAFKELAAQNCEITILGSYQDGKHATA